MGRKKKPTRREAEKNMENTKEMLDKVKTQNGMDVNQIFDLVKSVSDESEEGSSTHIPVHSLEEIKKKLGEKKVVKNDDGKEILQPVYQEEEKVKIIFGLLSEKGLNLLDFLEKILSETGYSAKVVTSINETFSRAAEVLRDISEMQYRKSKLENERAHLEIQKYKADLKRQEIEIKAKANEKESGNTNVIAVGSTSELLDILNGKKGKESIVEVEGQVKEEE